jgi:hypothetical protein
MLNKWKIGFFAGAPLFLCPFFKYFLEAFDNKGDPNGHQQGTAGNFGMSEMQGRHLPE